MRKKFFLVFTAIFTFISANIIAQERNMSYKIGDKGPGGGIVFYYSESGFPVYESDNASPVRCHYLECSPVELGSIAWCPCTRSNGCNVRTERKVGGGKINTKRILNAHNADSLTPSNCAAKACSVYSTETTRAGEWYLPNSTELDLMWENVIGSWIINYIDGAHWSSQAGRNSAWYQAFSPNGSQSAGSESKYEYGGVRAVRAF